MLDHSPTPAPPSQGAPGSAPALSFVHVSRSYGEGKTEVVALRNFSLQLAEGEFVAVMGPSGSGKSTLLALAGGLDRPTSGDILVSGTPLSSLDSNGLAALRRHSVGYVFQSYNLVPSLTAVENVSLPLELDGLSLGGARKAAMAALEEIGVARLATRFPGQLSGGEQQRVAIARALVGDRRVLLADEPTGALDSGTGEEVLRVLRGRADAGYAVMMVTHEARHAGWADRIVFLRDGLLVEDSQDEEFGPLADIETPQDPR